MWLGQRWRDQRGCVWELLFQEGWAGLFTKGGAGWIHVLNFFPPCRPLSSPSFFLLTSRGDVNIEH